MSDGFYLADGVRPESGIGYYLSKARTALLDRMDRAVKPLGLTAQQISVILLLSSGRAGTPLELSRALSYDSGSMTRMLDRLEKKGFVARSRSDADRRMVRLELTPQGRDAASRLPALSAAVLDEQLRGFSDGDIAAFVALLGRFIANGADSVEEPARQVAEPAPEQRLPVIDAAE
jgi:DNA-binding MarR family transcriptional regulator